MTTIEGTRAIDRPVDGMLTKRALTPGRLAKSLSWPSASAGADVILYRNREMPVLASRARKLYAPRAALV
jgi:hypothetical protein